MPPGPCTTVPWRRSIRRAVSVALLGCAMATAWAQAAGGGEPSPSAPSARTLTVRLPKSRPDDIVWAARRFTYQTSGKRLSEVLQDFAASEGVPAIIAEGVDGVVHGDFDAPPSVFLDALGKAYGLIWYHDGTTLYVYPSSAMQTKLFRLKGYSRSQLEEMLGSLHLSDKRYPLRYNEAQSTLLAYGPPRHIEVVGAALESLDADVTERNQLVVRVFPLRYAYAGDRTLGSTEILPGVVTKLRGVYGAQRTDQIPGAENNSGRDAARDQMNAMQAMFFGKSDRGANPNEAREASPSAPAADKPAAAGAGQRGLRSPVNLEDDSPRFEADEPNNAIVVRGRLSKMDEYAELISRLDVRPVLVEFDAAIIDVRADQMEKLGINWSAQGPRGGVSMSQAGPGTGPSASGADLGTSTLSTLWSNAGLQLMSRIEALQADGQARVVARPRVLGLANRVAQMQEKRVAVVRVAGNLDARLYNVEAGTLLQVTPQVIAGNDGEFDIKLSIYIEDGSFEAQSVDQVPVVKRTQIRTEAQVREGESVLIGGISIESQVDQKSGVPGLSKVPLFGGLFRWSEQHGSRVERLFLITPKLVRDVGDEPAATQPMGEALDSPAHR